MDLYNFLGEVVLGATIDPKPDSGRNVLVVGTGNTGSDTAVDRAGHAADARALLFHSSRRCTSAMGSTPQLSSDLASSELSHISVPLSDKIIAADVNWRMSHNKLVSTDGAIATERCELTSMRFHGIIPVLEKASCSTSRGR